jgi:hypothetical protein
MRKRGPPGDASNPIVLDSDEEADQPVSSVQPSLAASQSTPRRENTHPEPPSSPNYLARSQASQSSSPSGASNRGDEFCEAESPSIQRTSPSPQSKHSVDQFLAVDANADQTLPMQDSSEIQDKMPNAVSEITRETHSPVASFLPPMSPKSKDNGISDRLAMARTTLSPNRAHGPPVDASTDTSVVSVCGTLYGGPSGLWKGFFKATTTEPASHSRLSCGIEEQGDAQSKKAPTPPRAKSPCSITSTALVSLARNMSIRSSPTPLSVDGRGLEISDDLTITTRDSVPSTPIGEPF